VLGVVGVETVHPCYTVTYWLGASIVGVRRLVGQSRFLQVDEKHQNQQDQGLVDNQDGPVVEHGAESFVEVGGEHHQDEELRDEVEEVVFNDREDD